MHDQLMIPSPKMSASSSFGTRLSSQTLGSRCEGVVVLSRCDWRAHVRLRRSASFPLKRFLLECRV